MPGAMVVLEYEGSPVDEGPGLKSCIYLLNQELFGK